MACHETETSALGTYEIISYLSICGSSSSYTLYLITASLHNVFSDGSEEK